MLRFGSFSSENAPKRTISIQVGAFRWTRWRYASFADLAAPVGHAQRLFMPA
jgi:hypothetical protein